VEIHSLHDDKKQLANDVNLEQPPPIWPFPTYKGQPYKPPRQPKQDPFKKYPPAPF
jgi:hypothetical protein